MSTVIEPENIPKGSIDPGNLSKSFAGIFTNEFITLEHCTLLKNGNVEVGFYDNMTTKYFVFEVKVLSGETAETAYAGHVNA